MRPKVVAKRIEAAGVPVQGFRSAYPGQPGEITLPRGVRVRFYGCVLYDVVGTETDGHAYAVVTCGSDEDTAVREALRLHDERGA